MKHQLGLTSLFLTGVATAALVQPVRAEAIAQIVNIQANQSGNTVELVLETANGEQPKVYAITRDNYWVADVANSQLKLPSGTSFRQDNPTPGIASLVVSSLNDDRVRIVVAGQGKIPAAEMTDSSAKGLVFKISTPANDRPSDLPSAASTQAASAVATPTIAAQPPTQSNPGQSATGASQPAGGSTLAQAQTGSASSPIAQSQAQTIPGSDRTPPVISPNPAPPTLPRAVPPPLGDISIANVDPSPDIIDLGTNERIPRLVLREAPAREVLSLLARAAGINLAYTDTSGQAGQPAAAAGQPGTGGPLITLDIENEPIQDVFNHVLRVSGLQANKIGRTVFVGPNLPTSAKNLVSRTIRLNQVSSVSAAGFLATLGAETTVSVPPQQEIVTQQIQGAPGTAPIVQTVTRQSAPTITTVTNTSANASLVLKGLQVTPDDRLNSILLTGNPRQVEIATTYLTHLDLRRRQVAVNVKIIDVNLSNTENIESSFSFGINNSFFINDGGAAAVNFGNITPAPRVDSVTSPPTVTNPITGTPFLDSTSSFTIPNGGGGFVDQFGNFTPNDATFLRPVAPLSPDGNPLTPGISNFTQGTPTIQTVDANGNIVTTRGTPSTITTQLPSLFQFPTNFLLRLQAQVISGNAKILTDPTLTVQEGQAASVNLTQEVFGGIQEQIVQPTTVGGVPLVTRNFVKTPVGLTLQIQVERIDDNGFVTMRIAPRVSSVAGTFTSGDQTAILTAQRELQSGAIRLRDGQTLILAGIIQESDRQTVSKIPILGDLPIIGSLFRTTDNSSSRTEVIVVVTPQILDDSLAGSNFGYGYVPSPATRPVLQRSGLLR